MKCVATIAVLLSGCAANGVTDRSQVQVKVIRPAPDQATCVASLRNLTGHSIFVLHPLLTFSNEPDTRLVEPPIFTGEVIPIYHANELRPTESLEFDASCTNSGAGPEANRYVGFYVCMHDKRSECSKYQMMWAEVPVNAT